MKLISIISILSAIFLIAISLNLTPYLRGPAPYPPEWQWPYYYTNTLPKVWFPLLVIFATLGIGYLIEKRPTPKYIIALVVLSYLFQLSVLYFSRAGISVLIHRIINPELNGYFTAATQIKNISHFIRTYQNNVLSYNLHATSHPPGSILFFYGINQLMLLFPNINQAVSQFIPTHNDVQLIWNALKSNEKSGALLAAFFIPLLSSLSLVPLLIFGKMIYGIKTAFRAAMLYIFIPSLTLFTPLSDVIFPLFSLWTLVFITWGIKTKTIWLLFFAGLIFSTGLFFSLSLLPLILIIYLYLIFKSREINALQYCIVFTLGLFIFYALLFVLSQFNLISVSQILLAGQKTRSYFMWVVYDLYDFFVFAGIPLFIIYLYMLLKRVKDPLFISFTIMLVILAFSGAVRGETGRIWLPLMSILALITCYFLTKQEKLAAKPFLCIIFLQAIQILVLQEFWVMMW